jgi:DNA-binding beta-propeller fold protein YncE
MTCVRARLARAALAAALLAATTVRAQLLISGNDEKIRYEHFKAVLYPPGKDTVSVIDIRDRAHPRIVANLPISNSIVGPPTNLAITPDQKLALVASSVDNVAREGGAWKQQPDDKVHVIDLTTSPPSEIGVVQVGKQPSGMAIRRAGDLALVANRADNTVSVLPISGKDVKLVATVAVSAPGTPSEQVSAVAITPDGKRALVSKFATHRVAVLDIDGQKVTYTKYDMAVGLWPLNVQITHDGKLGLAGNEGNPRASDGQIDTVAVIDLEAKPPRVIDQVVVGDGPEGLAVSPTGPYVASVILNGAGFAPDDAFFHTDHAYVSLLKVQGKKVRKVSQTDVGVLTEGVAFSPDGKYLYVGNFSDRDLTVLKLQGDRLVKVGSLKLPGQPASLRGSTP